MTSPDTRCKCGEYKGLPKGINSTCTCRCTCHSPKTCWRCEAGEHKGQHVCEAPIKDIPEAVEKPPTMIDLMNVAMEGMRPSLPRVDAEPPQPAPWEERFDDEFPKTKHFVSKRMDIKSFIADVEAAAEKKGREMACDYIRKGMRGCPIEGTPSQFDHFRSVCEAARAAQ